MCQLCKFYGKKQITDSKTLRIALEEAQVLYKSKDDEVLAHIDALTNKWLFGKGQGRDKQLEEEWERGHR